MKIALLNGSPKYKNSSSEILLADLKSCILEAAKTAEDACRETDILEITLHHDNVPPEIIQKLESADAWVFSCPLYVDGLPGHLLSCLLQLDSVLRKKELPKTRKIFIYGIVNCGFYEGIQAKTALEILKNWCAKTGLVYGGGIGVGGGGGLSMMSSPKPEKGPKAPIIKKLRAMADRMLRQEASENHYVSVAFPRFLYKMAAQMGWRQQIRANGKRAKDL
ncbi:MAG: NAD(P)H-dependent oxidoreductase [Lachnospiraceae bacterium]|nr:NAD(P)H-dependent oxidoreductase [Lachnospiraceae bacterium]